MEEVPETGAVFTFGKSRFGDDNANKFWVKNDPVIAVACGDEHTAVVTSTGRSYTFGSNQWGQLALGHTKQTNKPSFVKSLKGKPVTHVACGRSHTLFATKSEVYGCGGNGEHQVNDTSDDEVLTPYQLTTLSGIQVKRLSCGVEHSLVLGHCGEVYLWGTGSEGQLGMGPNVSELLKPTVLQKSLFQFTDEKIKDASCGYYHTGLVTQSGKVFTFGENDNGKLGLGEDADDTYHVPQPVFLVDSADRICCGNTCTAVMTSSGGLFMCGDGQRGQLGFAPNSLTKCVYTLTKVPCPPIVDISVGEGHTAVVSKSGHLYTFGDGRHGKLCHGDDNFATLHSPYLVESFSTIATVQTVACGGCHTMVIAKAGRPLQEEKTISSARSKRHGKGARLNDLREPSSLPAIKTNDEQNKENNLQNIEIVQENVKTLESALNEPPKKIVNLNNGNEKVKAEKLKEESKNDNDEKKKILEKNAPEDQKKKIVEEESGSETDEPGATSDDSEADSEDEDEEKTAGSESAGGFMDNIMGIEELEPVAPAPEKSVVTNNNVTHVKSSEVKASKSQSSEGESEKKPEVTNKEPAKTTSQPTLEESSEYETETDEEGEYEDETEEESEVEETEKKEIPVKTLVSDLPPEKNKGDEIIQDEPAPSTTKPVELPAETKPSKEPSKFKFWKKKSKREEKPPPPPVPGNQNSSKACVIL